VEEVRPGLSFSRMAALSAFLGAKRFDDQGLKIHAAASSSAVLFRP
jgi:hypothetical protein